MKYCACDVELYFVILLYLIFQFVLVVTNNLKMEKVVFVKVSIKSSTE